MVLYLGIHFNISVESKKDGLFIVNVYSTMKVFTGEWHHETNTFSIVPTTIENFKKSHLFTTDEDLIMQRKGTKSSYGAMYEATEKYNWTLDTSISADSNPSGRLTNECFETICSMLLHKVQKDKYDGIILHLHGAMVTESFEDAEGEILRRFRDIVGKEIPIIVTLDLHGNITSTMAQHASALIAVRTYPHIDYYEMAWKAADLLQRAMNGEVKLHTVIAKRPQLRGIWNKIFVLHALLYFFITLSNFHLLITTT